MLLPYYAIPIFRTAPDPRDQRPDVGYLLKLAGLAGGMAARLSGAPRKCWVPESRSRETMTDASRRPSARQDGLWNTPQRLKKNSLRLVSKPSRTDNFVASRSSPCVCAGGQAHASAHTKSETWKFAASGDSRNCGDACDWILVGAPIKNPLHPLQAGALRRARFPARVGRRGSNNSPILSPWTSSETILSHTHRMTSTMGRH
jgi:hypothetical protein